MKTVNEYRIPELGDPEPWGSYDSTLFEQIVNKLPAETLDIVTTGHHHYELYSPDDTASVITVDNTNTVFNEGGADRDHRFEGDNNENLLYLDAGNDRVGMGTATPRNFVDILNGAGGAQLRLTHTDNVDFSTFEVNGDGDMTIALSGPDFFINTSVGTGFEIDGTNGHIRVNASLSNYDFIVDGTAANLLVGDAANNRIGIGTATPAVLLDVDGYMQLQTGTPSGTSVNEFSTDNTLGGLSDDAVPTEKAVREHFENNIAGTTNRIGRFTANNTIGDSVITQNNDLIGINCGVAGNVDNTLHVQDNDPTDISAAQIIADNVMGIKIENESAGAGACIYFSLNQASEYSAIGSNSNSGNDSNMVFYTELAGTVAERIVISYDGLVGISQVDPNAMLEILDTTEQLRLTHTDDVDYASFTVDGNGLMTIATAGSANGHIYFNPAGNVGIGTNVPDLALSLGFSDNTAVTGPNVSGGWIDGLQIVNTDNTVGSGACIQFSLGGATAWAGIGAIFTNASEYSNLVFYTYDGSAMNEAARFDENTYPRFGVGETDPAAMVDICQPTSDGSNPIPCLELDQDDVSEGFINFVGSDRGIITGATDSTESVRVEINGSVRRLALYADA